MKNNSNDAIKKQYENILSVGKENLKGVQITAADDCCDYCKQFANKIFDLNNIPLLPHAGCTNKMGCRCNIFPIWNFSKFNNEKPKKKNKFSCGNILLIIFGIFAIGSILYAISPAGQAESAEMKNKKIRQETISALVTQMSPTETPTPTPGPTATKNPNSLTMEEASTFAYLAQNYVSQALKSPTSAAFPDFVFNRDQWRLNKTGNVITVQSWVDAENGFGAKLRNKFSVQFDYESQELLYMDLGGEVVYGTPQNQ